MEIKKNYINYITVETDRGRRDGQGSQLLSKIRFRLCHTENELNVLNRE